MDRTGADFQLSLLTGNDKYIYVRVHHQKSQKTCQKLNLEQWNFENSRCSIFSHTALKKLE